ncbi:MAG TPA: type II secretion system protein GspH [Alcanivorax sp.]|jgi:general secretion pathway protein H|uniref:type II secretion system protein n=1 Tax=Alloalcanivorax venustensis TaxID=172371 RepID=UPI000C5D60CA|nr:type II secretion system protein GspH [Alcanivorax sp.]MEC8879188.1 type II secretion system protein [Pseudomonadota bacterium]MBA4731456.1 type II secretion system protein [Alcanivorax sp.]MBF47578.1 type II secretion system protein GspH [Alcanivorax sp.]HAD46297.1 type II secretion system protein GspH [Alcanivorax sp.]|tara:strand:+ start:61528 stop:62268 length:741 start_codon:yes stop_codon:yes gene_type:complete
MWRAGPDAKPRGRRQSGFTLLEILVVVGLVAMLSLAVLVVPVWVDDQRQLDSESASLADTLTMLNEQSLFSGRLMALRVTERGWTPLTYDVGERAFVPAQGNGLQANRLPESLELTWQYDDLPDDEDEERVSLQDAAKQLVSDDPFGGDDQGLLGDDRDRDEPEDGRDEEEEDQEPLPQVFFFPSGETTPITFTVRSRQDLDLEARRQMTALGKVRDPDRDEEEEALTAPDEKPDDSLIDDDFLED